MPRATERIETSTERLPDGTRVHVRSEHFAGQCDGIITAAEYDEGWLYRIDVTTGDPLNGQRNHAGELWVCAFEVQLVSDGEAQARNARRERIETFEVVDDHLVRHVLPKRGEPYEHRCPLASFEQVAHAIEEAGDEAFTLMSLANREDLPSTQVAVALAFLKERGLVDTRYRRNYASTDSAHLDAMTEYWALAEKACLRRQG